MTTILAERTDAALVLTCSINKNGFIGGLTVAASVYDPSAAVNNWLNMTTGAWQAGVDTANMTEAVTGRHVIEVDLTQADAGSTHLQAFYEITAGATGGGGEDTIILGTEWYDGANATDQTLILADTAAIEPLVSTNLDVASSTLATASALATVDTVVDDILADTSVMQPQVATGVTSWITATGFATEAKQDVIDSIVDAILVQTTAGGAGPWTTGGGAAAPTVQEIVDGLWDEPQSPNHTTVGTFGYYVDAQISVAGGSGLDAAGVRAAIGMAAANMDTQLVPVGTNLDATVSSRSTLAQADILNDATPFPGAFIDTAISTAGTALDAAETRAALGMAAADLDTQLDAIVLDTGTTIPATLSGLSTQATQDVIDANVDAILVDTTAGGAGPWTTGAGGSAPTVEQIDAELTTQHGIGAWNGVAGAGITQQQVRDSMQLAATDATPAIDTKLDDLETQVGTRSSHAAADVDTTLSGVHGSGSWEGDSAATVDSTLTAAHGAGSWAGATGYATEAKQDVIDANVDAILADTAVGGPGPWTTGADPSAVWAHIMAGGATAQELQEAAGSGGVAPDVIASAVLDALLVDYELPGSFGQAVGDMDTTSLKLLLEAALGKLTRFGAAYGIMPCQKLFVGDTNVVFRVPILDTGELADLTGATISWRFVAPDDGAVITLPGTISGAPGHAEYTTELGDGIIDAAGSWRAQATATLLDTTVKASEIILVQVSATL